MKKLFVILTLLLLAFVLSAGCVQEPAGCVQEPEENPPTIPLEPGVVVVEGDVRDINRMYSLGLTTEEMLEIADGIKTGYLKDAERRDGLNEHFEYIYVEDRYGYHAELARVLGLSQESFERYIWMLEHPIVY